MFSNRLHFQFKKEILNSINLSSLRCSLNTKILSKFLPGICTSSLLHKRLLQLDHKILLKPTSSLYVSKKFTKTNIDNTGNNAKIEDKNVSKMTENLSEIAARQKQYVEKQKELTKMLEPDIQKKTPSKPDKLSPYIKLMRLDKLDPIHLVYWPAAWSILGAASYLHADLPDFYLLSLFAVGAVTMRSAGCIINDIWDRNIDSKVERTKDRPLASGQISLPVALVLLVANLSAALSVLMQLNLTTQLLGACCLFPVAIYPASKRFTNWPQAVLGVTFNWGVLMGWSAVICNNLDQEANLLLFLPALALYTACINWTIFYDTIYAFQDREHDIRLGLKSTAIYFQDRPKLWLLGFSSLTAANLALFGYLTYQEPIYYATVGLAMLHFLKQIAFLDINSPKSCSTQFRSNVQIGFLIAFGLLASVCTRETS